MKLASTTLYSALETGVKLGAGLVVIKFLALRTGPEGVAAFGQFQNIVAAFTAICSGAFVTGLVKHVAEVRSHDKDPQIYIRNALGFAVILCVICGATLVFSMRSLSTFALGDESYIWAFVALALSLLPITVFQIALAILNGFRQIRQLLFAKAVSSIFLLITSVLLTWYAGINGALLALTAAPALALLIAIPMVRKIPELRFQTFIPRFSTKGFGAFVPFWLMSLTTAITTPAVLVLIRTDIGNVVSWTGAGLWEASWRISELYLLVITTALATYYVPQLSATNSINDEKKLVISMGLFACGISTILAVSIYIFRDTFLYILFSPEFRQTRDLMLPQLIASIIKIGCWIITYHMIVKMRTAIFIVSEISFCILFYFLSIFFIKLYGLSGVSYAYLISMVFYATLCSVYFFTFINRPSLRPISN